MLQGLFKQRIFALLLIGGAGILFFRAFRMIFYENAFEILVMWVFLLLVAELIIDVACILAAFRWLISNEKTHSRLPLKLAAGATILHATRVFIYVLGRTGPWINFDVKPQHHDSYTFEWFWVYFAAMLSMLGILGIIVIMRVLLYKQKHSTKFIRR